MAILALLKNTTFLLITCGTLAVSTVGLAVKTASLTTQVGLMSANAAAAAIAHRKAIAAAVARAKAKARLRRLAAAVPIVGIGAVAEFERRDFLAWQEDNPDGTYGEYGCEVATISAEVMDEVLQELPERVRPRHDRVLGLLPECEITGD